MNLLCLTVGRYISKFGDILMKLGIKFNILGLKCVPNKYRNEQYHELLEIFKPKF